VEAIRVKQTVERDGEIRVQGLPCEKGQEVEVIVLLDAPSTASRARLTARRLLESGLVGLWEGRNDIEDSAAYARRLREDAQRRRR
jgi:hypothetical protein